MAGAGDVYLAEFFHAVGSYTTGDNTIVAGVPDKVIRLQWVQAITNPVATSVPLIKIGFGPSTSIVSEIYRAWALSKRQRKSGAVGDNLIINLSGSVGEVVAVTAIYEIITP